MKKRKLKELLYHAENRNEAFAVRVGRLESENEKLTKELTKWRTSAIEMQNYNANFIKVVATSLGVTQQKINDAYDADKPGQVKEPYFDMGTGPKLETPKPWVPEPESAGAAAPRGIIHTEWPMGTVPTLELSPEDLKRRRESIDIKNILK